MAHKFNPKNLHKLDNHQRRTTFPPKEILQKLGLKPDDILADIGAGIGYFTIPASKIINSELPIYALDTVAEMLAVLKDREHETTGESKITTVQTEEYDLKLPRDSITFALMVNVLHEIDDKAHFLKEIHNITKTGGKLALIDWMKCPTESGPPVDHRISKEETTDLLIATGYSVVNTLTFAETFYGIIAMR